MNSTNDEDDDWGNNGDDGKGEGWGNNEEEEDLELFLNSDDDDDDDMTVKKTDNLPTSVLDMAAAQGGSRSSLNPTNDKTKDKKPAKKDEDFFGSFGF